MSFEDLKPHKNGSPPKAPVRLSMVARGESPARMKVLISREVLGHIGGAAQGFQISLGKDVDKHLLRIRPSSKEDLACFKAAAAPKGRGEAGAFWWFLLPPGIEQFPNVPVPLLEAKWEVRAKEKALYITLPAWAWDPKSRDQMR